MTILRIPARLVSRTWKLLSLLKLSNSLPPSQRVPDSAFPLCLEPLWLNETVSPILCSCLNLFLRMITLFRSLFSSLLLAVILDFLREKMRRPCYILRAPFPSYIDTKNDVLHILAHRVVSALTVSVTATATDSSGPRRRATSSANPESPSDPTSPQSKHNRANSELSLVKGFSPTPPANPRGQSLASRPGRMNLQNNFTIPDPQDAPPLSAHPAFRQDKSQDSSDPASKLVPPSKGGPSIARISDNSFLDMEESDADSSNRYSDDIPILQRNDDSFLDKPTKVVGVTFDELVDRLVAQTMSRADNNFCDIFLCLYRKFAAPGELFDAILARLQKYTDDKGTHYLPRTATQLRIVNVVAKWVSSYPGDFASRSTSRKLDAFINELAGDPVFAAAAQEMRGQLQSRVVVDDDTGWARTDPDVDQESGVSRNQHPPSPVLQKSHAHGELNEEMGNLNIDEEHGEAMERKESHADSTLSAGAMSPIQSLAPSYQTVEDYEREASSMVPRSMIPLTKFRYHIFMDTSDDDFADEMTRIDWVMFSSIRLRDLVRHVSLSLEEKEKCRSLNNVNRMISHFNHIARWVANMILIRDKAKHRALVLEKFMNIALKLRQLNNYNGLAAVLAGINGTAIHRLAQTRALVPADVQKRFARLVLLMGTQKSHFAYRLAWENSPFPRIPFIPLHRRDLVSAEEGSRTFVGANGDRINWKKFEVLAEVILPIMKSQVVPYPNLTKHDTAREFILDCRMPTDEEVSYPFSFTISYGQRNRSILTELGYLPTQFAVRELNRYARGGEEEVPMVSKVVLRMNSVITSRSSVWDAWSSLDPAVRTRGLTIIYTLRHTDMINRIAFLRI